MKEITIFAFYIIVKRMTFLRDFLLLLIPAIIIGIGLWVAVRYYVKTEKDKLIVQIGLKNKEIITPVRLQAYERVILLLERMEPSQIIIRNVVLGQTASQLKQSLINNIREEFDHNLSQQLYVSSEAWSLIKNARELSITAVTEAAAELSPDASASDLAQLLFHSDMLEDTKGIHKAIEYVKNEARLMF